MIIIEIALPVLNEESTLEMQVNIILQYIDEIENDDHYLTLVIADNGSTDATREIARQLQIRNSSRIRLVSNDKKGVGLALKSAWLTSTADIVGYMDLDLATDLQHIKQVISAFVNNKCDILYGTRLNKQSEVIGRTLKREVVSRSFNLILKLYLSAKFSDGMCGFKFMKRGIVEELIANGATSDGWFFCTEVLIVAERLKKKLFELPVRWVDDSSSKVKIIPLSLEYVSAMRKLK